MIWRPIDALARWLRDTLGYQVQLRFGVVTVLASLPLYPYAPFSGEPPLIYVMSALAITLTGVGIVIAAEAAKEAANPPGSGRSGSGTST